MYVVKKVREPCNIFNPISSKSQELLLTLFYHTKLLFTKQNKVVVFVC